MEYIIYMLMMGGFMHKGIHRHPPNHPSTAFLSVSQKHIPQQCQSDGDRVFCDNNDKRLHKWVWLSRESTTTFCNHRKTDEKITGNYYAMQIQFVFGHVAKVTPGDQYDFALGAQCAMQWWCFHVLCAFLCVRGCGERERAYNSPQHSSKQKHRLTQTKKSNTKILKWRDHTLCYIDDVTSGWRYFFLWFCLFVEVKNVYSLAPCQAIEKVLRWTHTEEGTKVD